jgi:DNA modification methylase
MFGNRMSWMAIRWKDWSSLQNSRNYSSFVKSLSYRGSIVLDFFAGSPATVVVWRKNHSIMVDSDAKNKEYLNQHHWKWTKILIIEYEILPQKYRY